jgi:hypothetical protein
MPQLRIRITGSDDAVRDISDLLTSVPGIEHVEEIDDLMPHMDDPDSSSAGLSDDEGPGMHLIEVEAPNETAVTRVRELVEVLAFDLDVLVEFETDEDDVRE